MARWVILGGLAALVALGYFANYSRSNLPGLHSTMVVRDGLKLSAEKALAGLKADWADVRLHGQIATVSGEARTEGERDAAIEAVRKSSWGGGPVWGGIVHVRDRVALAPEQKPFVWSATVTDGRRLTITGFTPSEAAKAEVYAQAISLFPSGVKDLSKVARGAPQGNWPAATNWSLSLLSKLVAGEASFSDTQFALRGVTDNPGVQTFVQNGVGQIYQPFTGTADVALVGEQPVPAPAPAPVEETPAVETPAVEGAAAPPLGPPPEPPEPEAAGRSAAAVACQTDIDNAMANAIIEFDSAAAVIRKSSHGLLDRIAGVAGDCPSLKLIVSGHTDASGSPILNRQLSKTRAQSVVNYLRLKGVAKARMSAKGYGSAKPIASNTTDAGKARNRRIQITVTD